MRAWLAELRRRDPVLATVGGLMVLLFVALLALAPFDHRQAMGINPYIKPMKFSLSIAAYLWTVGWFLGYLTRPRWALWTIRCSWCCCNRCPRSHRPTVGASGSASCCCCWAAVRAP